MTGIGAIGEGLAEVTLDPVGESIGLGVGGDAPNVCVMAARLGAPARLLGRIGDDGLGRRLAEFWTDRGVDLSHLRTDAEAPTGLYVNETGPDGAHRFTHWRARSAGSRLEPGDLQPQFFDGLGVLVVTGVTLAVSRSSADAAHEAVARAGKLGIRVACVLNHRPALGVDVDELAALAAASQIVIGSREDLEGIFGDADAGRDLLERGASADREIALTDGARSAFASWASGTVGQPVPSTEVRNAAGAGDAFAGAYLASRLADRSPAVALAWAVAAATLSVGEHGCALSYPSGERTARLAGVLPAQAPHGHQPSPA